MPVELVVVVMEETAPHHIQLCRVLAVEAQVDMPPQAVLVAVLPHRAKQKQAVVVVVAVVVILVAGEVVAVEAHKFLEHYHLGAPQRELEGALLA
jgi:hypothetical protein